LFDPGVEQAGRGGGFAEPGGKIRVGVADDFHGVRLEGNRREVKIRGSAI
jgi:hypothetical protein